MAPHLARALEGSTVLSLHGHLFDSGYINAASVFLGLDTPLGPLNFSYGFNDEREKALYLNLGKSF